MLRCMQSSMDDDSLSCSSGFDPSAAAERHELTFERLFDHHHHHLRQQQQQLLEKCPQQPNIVNNNVVDAHLWLPPVKIDHSFDQSLPEFSVYGDERFSLASSIANSTFVASREVEKRGAAVVRSTGKKRKGEQREGETKRADKKIGGEMGESESEITVKSETRENSKASEVKKPDYIHVRARRGQATDSHSLAERARREKISKKMRCLQDLVPGCNKITGKAGMLDEIINYVQSLQKQVEFLSMKLGALNPRLDFNVDHLFAKEIPAYIASFPASSLEMVNSNYPQVNPLQQGGSSSGVNVEMYLDSSSSCVPQLPTWDPDWQNLYNNINFH